jgi:hypothetical protein
MFRDYSTRADIRYFVGITMCIGTIAHIKRSLDKAKVSRVRNPQIEDIVPKINRIASSRPNKVLRSLLSVMAST